MSVAYPDGTDWLLGHKRGRWIHGWAAPGAFFRWSYLPAISTATAATLPPGYVTPDMAYSFDAGSYSIAILGTVYTPEAEDDSVSIELVATPPAVNGYPGPTVLDDSPVEVIKSFSAERLFRSHLAVFHDMMPSFDKKGRPIEVETWLRADFVLAEAAVLRLRNPSDFPQLARMDVGFSRAEYF